MPKNEQQLRTEIRRFVIDELLMGDASAMLGDGESFLETGTIDSTGVLEVVMFLEQRFELKVEDRELIPENLDSVDNLVRFVIRKTPRLQPQLEHVA
jgi:acyl carrier protein